MSGFGTTVMKMLLWVWIGFAISVAYGIFVMVKFGDITQMPPLVKLGADVAVIFYFGVIPVTVILLIVGLGGEGVIGYRKAKRAQEQQSYQPRQPRPTYAPPRREALAPPNLAAFSDLQRLADLQRSGILSPQEFEAAKARVLNRV